MNLPELPNTIFMVVICCVSNTKDMVLAPNQLQTLYTDVRHWEELFVFIHKNGGQQEPYILTSMFQCAFEQDQLDEKYMELYINGHIIMFPWHSQIVYTCWLPNAFELKLGHNRNIFLVEIERATGQKIVEHRIKPTKVIPTSCVKSRCAQLLMIMHRHWKVLKRAEERRQRGMVGNRMILVLMQVLIRRVDMILLHPDIFVPMVACL